MKLDSLYLEDFKNLKKFKIDFHVSSSKQVIVGRNGVGKSNLLEAISYIFRDLDLEQDSVFAYELQYHCNNHYIKIGCKKDVNSTEHNGSKFTRTYGVLESNENPKESKLPRVYKKVLQAEFYQRNRRVNGKLNPDRLLPSYVFGYYSGISSKFINAFERHEELYYQAQIGGDEVPLRSLFLAKPHHSKLALLSFFVDSYDSNDTIISDSEEINERQNKIRKFLLNEFGIVNIHSVLFCLHEPYWNRIKSKNAIKVDDETDLRFWGIQGKVATFLDSLYKNSFIPMAGIRRHRISIGQERKLEMRYCYLPSETSVRNLTKDLAPKEFFSRLEGAVFSDIINPDRNDIVIRINVSHSKEPITFNELSEGEQQLLTMIGLMKFTQQNESLFLLDEPDTHLNPAWCLNYLSNLQTYGIEPPNSQIVMTTHSPLTFAGLDENEVVILQKRDNGVIFSQHPITPPKGMGFQAIITSDFFGLRSTLDIETLKLLDKKRELGIKENKTEEDVIAILELEKELGKLDFSKSARDPLYLEYIRAMTIAQKEHPSLAQAAPDISDWRLRKQVAKDIAIRLLKNQKNQS